jgi:hypothetical protein
MALDIDFLNCLINETSKEAWRIIIDKTIEITSSPLGINNATSEVTKRDREIGAIDHFLSSSGWELWRTFGKDVEHNSDCLIRWWDEPYTAKAILILDGLSLRELPWLLEGAKERGFNLHHIMANASELPAKTTPFAKALGFSSRSQLQNNDGVFSHYLQPAQTESVDMPWKDCENLVNSSLNWIFWHHYPDSKIHDDSGAGQGLSPLTRHIAEQLTSDDFWAFVEKLATGRRLVITSDHGYAATEVFTDAEGDVHQFLKNTFASGRSKSGVIDTGAFIPPVAMQIDSHTLTVGRWKWKSQGGYPTLTHGGLSLLEVLSPWVEISKIGA